jgi:hypothetical protein
MWAANSVDNQNHRKGRRERSCFQLIGTVKQEVFILMQQSTNFLKI